jgi:hypothetical protein
MRRALLFPRLSGPLLDRIDLHVEVPGVPDGRLAERTGRGGGRARCGDPFRWAGPLFATVARSGAGRSRVSHAVGTIQGPPPGVPGRSIVSPFVSRDPVDSVTIFV